MKCAICKNGTTSAGRIIVVLNRDSSLFVFKDVPADICDNCGEEYVAADINSKLLKRAGNMESTGVEFELLKYAA